jgi:predicted GTPase
MLIYKMLMVAVVPLISFMIVVPSAYAKRMPPKKLEAVEYGDILVVAPLSLTKYKEITKKNGVYLEIWGKSKTDLKWWIQVYTIDYKKGLETDIQDIFLKHIEVKDGVVVVTNELGMIFSVDLQEKTVKLIKDVEKKLPFHPLITVSGENGSGGGKKE